MRAYPPRRVHRNGRYDPADVKRLDALAEVTGVNAADHMRQALSDYLRGQERALRARPLLVNVDGRLSKQHSPWAAYQALTKEAGG